MDRIITNSFESSPSAVSEKRFRRDPSEVTVRRTDLLPINSAVFLKMHCLDCNTLSNSYRHFYF